MRILRDHFFIHAQRPLELWTYAMDAAVYVNNRMPNRMNPGMISPYEMLTGELPRLDQLRVMFCPAYARQDSKYPTKSRPFIFVGYPKSGVGWDLLDPIALKPSRAYDVEFDELQGGFEISQDPPTKGLRYDVIARQLRQNKGHPSNPSRILVQKARSLSLRPTLSAV